MTGLTDSKREAGIKAGSSVEDVATRYNAEQYINRYFPPGKVYHTETKYTLSVLVKEIGSADATIIVWDTQTLTANLTIPSNITLKIMQSGLLNVSTFTLTINGPFEAGLFQVFDSNATVSFSGNTVIKHILTQWWGAAGDSDGSMGTGTDNATPFASAYAAAETNNIPIFLPRGNYRIGSSWEIMRSVVYGNNSTIFKDFDGNGITITEGGSVYTDLYDIRVDTVTGLGDANTSHGIYIEDSRCRFSNVDVRDQGGNGIDAFNDDGNMNHCKFDVDCQNNGNHGFYVHGNGADCQDWIVDLQLFDNYVDGFRLECPNTCRDFYGRIYAEDNGQDSGAGVNLNIIYGRRMWFSVYLETGETNDYVITSDCLNIAIIGRLGSGSNKSTTSYLSSGGNKIAVKNNEMTAWIYNGLNLGDANNEYMDMDYTASGDDLVFRQRVAGSGRVSFQAMDRGDQYQTLRCGTLATANQVAAAWSGISDGQFQLNIGGAGLQNITVDFTGDADMDDVAASIQTGIQVVYSDAVCIYSSDWKRFEIYEQTDSQTIAVLTAGAGGTDISSMMQGLTGEASVVDTGFPKSLILLDPSAESMTIGLGGDVSGTGRRNVVVTSSEASPEGVVTADEGSLHFNLESTSNRNPLYMKGNGSGNTGWIQVYGDFVVRTGDTTTFQTSKATNVGISAAEYMYYDWYGSSDILLLDKKIRGDGVTIWNAYDPNNPTNVGAALALYGDEEKAVLSAYNAGAVDTFLEVGQGHVSLNFSGAEDFRFVANDFQAQGGSTISIADLTQHRVLLAGALGVINDSANFTFDGSAGKMTGSFELAHASSNPILTIDYENTDNAGDPQVVFAENGTGQWAFGMDTAASNACILTPNATVGGNLTDFYFKSTPGLGIGGEPTLSGVDLDIYVTRSNNGVVGFLVNNTDTIGNSAVSRFDLVNGDWSTEPYFSFILAGKGHTLTPHLRMNLRYCNYMMFNITKTDSYYTFQSNSTETMRLTWDGHLKLVTDARYYYSGAGDDCYWGWDGSKLVMDSGAGNMAFTTNSNEYRVDAVNNNTAVRYLNSSGSSNYFCFSDGTSTDELQVRLGCAGDSMIFRAHAGEAMRIVTNQNVVIGNSSASAKLHVDQKSTTGGIPVLYLDQADVSEEMIEFNTTIGVGNAIEAVGAKTLTTTHFIKVTLPGGLTRYIPCGTIA